MAAAMANPLRGYEDSRGPFVRAMAKAEHFLKSKFGLDAVANKPHVTQAGVSSGVAAAAARAGQEFSSATAAIGAVTAGMVTAGKEVGQKFAAARAGLVDVNARLAEGSEGVGRKFAAAAAQGDITAGMLAASDVIGQKLATAQAGVGDVTARMLAAGEGVSQKMAAAQAGLGDVTARLVAADERARQRFTSDMAAHGDIAARVAAGASKAGQRFSSDMAQASGSGAAAVAAFKAASPDGQPASLSEARSLADVNRLLHAGANARAEHPSLPNPLTHVIFNMPDHERAAAVTAMLTLGNADAAHVPATGIAPMEIASRLGDSSVMGALMDRGATFGKSEFIALFEGAKARALGAREANDREGMRTVVQNMKESLGEAFKRMGGEDKVNQLMRDPDIQQILDSSPVLRETIHSAQQVFAEIDKAKIDIDLSQSGKSSGPRMG